MAWSLLSSTHAVGASSGTVTTTGIDTTGATLIVIIYGGLLTAVLSDNQSNTNWYRHKDQRPSSGGYGVGMFFIVNPTTNASHTFTAAIGSAFPALAVMAFSGSYGGVELATGTYNASSQTVAPGSITPSSDNALLVTGYSDSATTGTRSINAGFTIANQGTGNATGGTIASAYLIQTSAAASNPTWTTTAAATGVEAMQMSFLLRPAGGGSSEHAYTF